MRRRDKKEKDGIEERVRVSEKRERECVDEREGGDKGQIGEGKLRERVREAVRVRLRIWQERERES